MADQAVKLSVRDVCKTFRIRGGGENRLLNVLRGVSFDVNQGEIVSLIGESGCGKTTLLKIIQGLIRLDSGTIAVDGQSVLKAGRDRGFVFQQASLLPWRTARRNVEFGLELQGVPKRERRERAERLLELVGLAHAGDQYPHQLSGGMQQRIGLARALAIDPAILLMDEPFSALDAMMRVELQDLLLKLWDELKLTVVFVTHDLDEALYLAQRVIVFSASPGTIAEVVEVPLSYPRQQIETRSEPVYLRLRERLYRSMVEQVTAGRAEVA